VLTAGIADRGGEFGEADVVHASLDDWVFDAKQFSDASLHASRVHAGSRIVKRAASD
jgi:hypothetical protein